MPPEGYQSVTVPEEVVERLSQVMVKYDLDNLSEAVRVSSKVALEADSEPESSVPEDELIEFLQTFQRTHEQLGSAAGQILHNHHQRSSGE